VSSRRQRTGSGLIPEAPAVGRRVSPDRFNHASKIVVLVRGIYAVKRLA
jgi:hypothetical protein